MKSTKFSLARLTYFLMGVVLCVILSTSFASAKGITTKDINVKAKVHIYEMETFEKNGMKFQVNSPESKFVIIYGLTKKISKLKIPNTVKFKGVTFKVVSIWGEWKDDRYGKNIKELTFGKYIKDINPDVFRDCKKLTKVNLGNVQEIGFNAFTNTNLKTLIIPKSVKTINSSAFSECKNLTRVTISKKAKLTVLPSSLFSKCSKLTSLTLSQNIKKINSYVISKCKKLKNITIYSKKIRTIENGLLNDKVFQDLSKGTKIRVPKSVKAKYTRLFKRNGVDTKKVTIVAM